MDGKKNVRDVQNVDATCDNAWCEHHIYGVEKDYRLARVAKVFLYMNGAGQGKIKFGDGLEQYTEEQITNEIVLMFHDCLL